MRHSFSCAAIALASLLVASTARGGERERFAAKALRELYGPVPTALLRDFQDKGGLVVTGELDAATIRELKQALIMNRYHGGVPPLPRRRQR